MKNTAWLFLVFVLISSLFLAACGSAAPAASTTSAVEPVETAATDAQPEGAYPAPAVAVPVSNPYPGPSEGVTNYADWAKAESAILDGLVSQVYEAGTLHVTLVMKDGSVMLTTEPSADEVARVLERCGDACKDVEKINP